jgi:D-alanyl-D-alanine carboxypeptidase (penicillin-binding protein 5/6)
LAEYIGGTVSNFADMMNKKALELGCKDTHFVNPNGLHDDNHYSCAHDITIMYKYAYDNFEDFRRIISLESCSLPTSEKYEKEDRVFKNSNKLINPSSLYFYDNCNGGKTGYTKEAKNCLVSSASSGDITLICTVLGGSQDESNASQRYNDTMLLFDKGFESFSQTTFLSKGTIIKKIKVENAKDENAEVSAITSGDLIVLIDKDSSVSDFESITTLKDSLVAPVFSGDSLGKITYDIYGITYTVGLIADKTIEEIPPITAWDILKVALLILIVIILIVVIICFLNVSKHKKAKSRHLFNVKRYNSRFHK